MNKSTVIAMLIKCANELDQQGELNDASALDGLVTKLHHSPEKHPGVPEVPNSEYQDDLETALRGMGFSDDLMEDSTGDMEQPIPHQQLPRHSDPKRFIHDLESAGVRIQ